MSDERCQTLKRLKDHPIANPFLCVLYVSVVLFALSGCASADPATPTAERTLTGPTIEPSPPFVAPTIALAPADEFFGQSDPTAAALAPDSAMPPLAVPGGAPVGERQVVEITAEDGTQLIGYLYLSDAVRLPGVLLIAPDREVWGDFPERLHNAGFTVLVMGLRPEFRLADFRVMMLSMSSGLALPDSLGVVGAGEGADVALLGCAGELLCDTVALLSPSDSASLSDAMLSYNPRPILLVASEDDPVSYPAVQNLNALATGEKLLQPFTSAGVGAAMLANRPDLGDLIIQWFERQLGP